MFTPADRYWKCCKCRKWLYISGSRESISAKTRSWEQAQQLGRQIEQDHAKTTSGGAEQPIRSASVKTVREAVTHFLEDKAEQKLSKNWLQKYRRELAHFANWCDAKVRYVALASLDLFGLENYRKTWTGAAATRRKRQERLRSFFRYCVRHKWVAHNVAADLESIKTKTPPKLPPTRAEFAAVMAAVEHYHPRGRDSEWRRMRAAAMLLLLRWSGLRISDAAKLERTALTDSGSLRLYMQKTGEPVYVPLPPDLVTMLRELPNPDTLVTSSGTAPATSLHRHPLVVYPDNYLQGGWPARRPSSHAARYLRRRNAAGRGAYRSSVNPAWPH